MIKNSSKIPAKELRLRANDHKRPPLHIKPKILFLLRAPGNYKEQHGFKKHTLQCQTSAQGGGFELLDGARQNCQVLISGES